MYRVATLTLVTISGLLLGGSQAQAQVFVRVPFVRVETGGGGGTYVRAPFVNLWIPPSRPYQMYPGPGVAPTPAAPGVFPAPGDPNAPPYLTPLVPQTPAPANPVPVNPAPPVLDLPFPQVAPGIGQNDAAPPPPQPQQTKYPTLQEFSKSFQARAGSFDVTILNPVTNQPTQVRFTLPDGSPRRVIVNHDEIEFRYAPLQFVRIEFDRNGATVTSRMR